jgi:hypothetical protein
MSPGLGQIYPRSPKGSYTSAEKFDSHFEKKLFYFCIYSAMFHVSQRFHLFLENHLKRAGIVVCSKNPPLFFVVAIIIPFV